MIPLNRRGIVGPDGNDRCGFSLVELLAVIAIMGVLIGLLLPAVQAARESGRRSLCTNNLKQLGLGLHGFHGVNGRFPAAFKAANTYPAGSASAGTFGQGISWVASVLPFIEQSQLFDQINFSALNNWTAGVSDLNLALARANRPGYLLCPSAHNGDSREGLGSSDVPVSNPAYTAHYYGIMGCVVPRTLAASYPRYTSGTPNAEHGDTPTQGMFPGPELSPRQLPRGVSMKDVTDGLSKTYLLGEISWAGMGTSSGSLEVRSYLTGYNSSHVLFIRSARNIYYPRPINISKAEWATTRTPSRGANAWNNLNWGSNHPDGAHFLIGDGAVGFVQESISMDVFMAAGSRNCGEIH